MPETAVFLNIDSSIKLLKFSSYSNPDSSAVEVTYLLKKADSLGYRKGVLECMTLQSSIQGLKGNYDSAISIASAAISKIDTLKEPRTSAELFNEVGISYDFKGDYKKAVDYYNKALHFFQVARDTVGYIKVKNNIGLIYQNIEDYSRAKEYFEECLALARSKQYEEFETMALSNLAAIELDRKEFNLALGHFKQVLEKDIETANDTYISYSYNNIAEAYKHLNQFDSAESYFRKSIALKEKLNIQVPLLNSYKQYADLLLQQKRIKEAENYLQRAFTIARKTGSTEYLQQCFELQMNVAKQQGNYQLAFTALDTAHFLKDSIAGAKYKAELIAKEKDYALYVQGLEKEQQQKELEEVKSEKIIFLICLVLFATLSVTLLILFRRQKYLNRLQQLQHQKLENYTKQLAQQKEIIEQGLDSKNKFLSFLAHEIRNPLSGIIGLNELLMDTDLNESQKEFVDYQQKASQGLLALLNEVLDYQKLVSGKIELNTVKFDLKDLLQQVRNLYSGYIKEKNLLFQLNIDHKIPDLMYGDPIRLTQVFSNLINNAIKFTPHNGIVTVNALIKEESPSGCLIYFAISDTGSGVPKEEQDKIFDLYEQAKLNKGTKGTGLGLSIVKNLLDLMNSKIQLKSQEDVGSTFSFEIHFTLPE